MPAKYKKQCRTCNKTKPITEFTKNGNSHKSSCKPCVALLAAARLKPSKPQFVVDEILTAFVFNHARLPKRSGNPAEERHRGYVRAYGIDAHNAHDADDIVYVESPTREKIIRPRFGHPTGVNYGG